MKTDLTKWMKIQEDMNREFLRQIEDIKRDIRIMKFGHDPKEKSAYDLSDNG